MKKIVTSIYVYFYYRRWSLKGEITPQGAKNEALQVICATLLTEHSVRIKNIPNILDVNNLIQLLRDMNVSVVENAKGDFTFCAADSLVSAK